jgi:hypothetical protein
MDSEVSTRIGPRFLSVDSILTDSFSQRILNALVISLNGLWMRLVVVGIESRRSLVVLAM